MTPRRGLLILFILGCCLLTGLLSLQAEDLSKPAPPAAAPPPALAPAEVYTFPSVIHTPDETARARLAGADMVPLTFCISSGQAVDESNADRDNRFNAAIKSLGFEVLIASSCQSGVKGWFTSSLSNGKPGIVLCQNQHETSGDITNTLVHEMGHAAQYCLGRSLSSVYDLRKEVVDRWRSFEKEFPEHIPSVVKQVLRRVRAGEKLSLEELLITPERWVISELYPPNERELEIEARVVAYLGLDRALSFMRETCKGRIDRRYRGSSRRGTKSGGKS